MPHRSPLLGLLKQLVSSNPQSRDDNAPLRQARDSGIVMHCALANNSRSPTSSRAALPLGRAPRPHLSTPIVPVGQYPVSLARAEDSPGPREHRGGPATSTDRPSPPRSRQPTTIAPETTATMSALRQTVTQIARQARQARSARPAFRQTRSYASGHGHHEQAHNVEEPLGVRARRRPAAAAAWSPLRSCPERWRPAWS